MVTKRAARREMENRYELRNRYLFTGQFEMETALHIGGGNPLLGNSDSPVVLTPEQKPFIPGSSFKGSLRSTVEKIVPGLPEAIHFSSCALEELTDEQAEWQEPQEGAPPEWPAGVCPTAWQGGLSRLRRRYPAQEQKFVREAYANLCDTCLLFGSPFAAARLNVSDLYTPSWNSGIERRDGVAIDRDSEKARDRLKYDFEVVPASTSFDLKIVLENATERDLQLLCVGLSEFVHGFGTIGGKRSRGLGMGKLKGLQVAVLELGSEDVTPEQRGQRLRDYLIEGKLEQVTGEDFLRKYIERLFAEPER
ncbi:MAG TPA: CRISPR-associated RAMP protein Csx7 [Ktedonobacteraceae bacterium]